MSRPERITHLAAALVFSVLALITSIIPIDIDFRWSVFRVLSLAVSGLAWLLFFRSRYLEKKENANACRPDQLPSFPEGQARLIDSGRLPNRYHPRVDLHEFEICHFYVPASRVIFAPLTDSKKMDPSRLAVRYSGGNYYYIVRPQEILMPAEIDDKNEGELIITSQRIIFLASENAFEVPLQRVTLLDCSAHLIDFQVRQRRYTIQTEAACYAEKVLMLLFQRPTL